MLAGRQIEGALQYQAQSQSRQQSARGANPREANGAHDAEAENSARLSAQRHAQPELARALSHRKRDGPIDAGGGQQHGERGEDGYQEQAESVALQSVVETRLHAGGIVNGGLGIGGAQLAAQGRNQSFGIDPCLDREGHGARRILGKGKVDVAEYHLIKPQFLDVRGDADDLHWAWRYRRAPARLQRDRLADRAFGSEYFPGKVLVDDGDALGGLGIALSESAPLHQRNRHYMEEAGRDHAS